VTDLTRSGVAAQADGRPAVTVPLSAASAPQTRLLGRRLASLLRRGDLVVLAGALGAGKTTLAAGIGAGLGVRGPVTSPTFVIARVHPSLTGDRDRLVDHALSEEIASAIRDSKLIKISGAGHLVILERPDEVNEAIAELVTRALATRAGSD